MGMDRMLATFFLPLASEGIPNTKKKYFSVLQ